MVQSISVLVGDCATKFGSLCARFVDTGAPVKIQVGNGLNKLLNLQGQNIDVYYQNFYKLKYLGIHDEEGNKIDKSNPLTAIVHDDGAPRPG